MRCMICSSPTVQFYDEKMAVETYRCEHCGCTFKSPRTHQSIAVQKSRYDLHENDETDSEYRAYFQRFLEFVLPQVGTPRTALDFGCGKSTLLAKLLEEQGITCDVYDPIYHPNIEYHSKKYELIVSTEVFEHLHHPKRVFKMLLERLETDGYLGIQTQFVPGSVEAYLRWYYRQDPTHIVFFAPQTFASLCTDFSCKIVLDNDTNMILIQKAS